MCECKDEFIRGAVKGGQERGKGPRGERTWASPDWEKAGTLGLVVVTGAQEGHASAKLPDDG